jgi:cobalamin biosynthesis protein CobT
MNERVAVMREAVVKLTQMLAGKGVRVTQQGVQAFVEPGPTGEPARVNLPFIPDNASNELIEAIQGFLDHEVAHILFTDFKAMGAIKNPSLHSMVNLIEDARIEKAMAQRFTGSGHNITTVGKFFLEKYTKKQVAEAAKRGDVNAVKATVMVPAIRAMAGQQIFKEFMANHPDLQAAVADEVSKIEHLASKIENCASTADAIDVAKEVLTALGSDSSSGGGGAAPKKKPKPAGGAAKAGVPMKSKGSSSGSGEESEEEDEEGSGGGKPGDEESDEEKDEEGGAGGKSEDDSDESDEEKDEGSDEEKDEDEDKDEEPAVAAPEEEDESDDDDEGNSTDGSSGGFLEALDKETRNGFDETMSNLITNEAIDAANGSDYLIYTKDHDVVEPLHVGSGFDPAMSKRMSEQVDHMVGPLQKDLERAISARSLSVWENGRRSGRLHAGNLSRLAVGDSRVFRKKHESTSKDVAVELVVDMSGSMSGSKIHTAAKAAYALASVLDRLNIKCEVVCFTTGPIEDRERMEKELALLGKGKSFSRVESLYMPILKGFNDRMTSTETRNRFAWLPHSSSLANNVDGESIEVAARRLLARREAGKIMIVLSDGAPAAYYGGSALRHHLKKTVEQIEKAGVRVVGIGIESSEVTHFYKRNMVLNDVTELPARVMKELRHLLIG